MPLVYIKCPATGFLVSTNHIVADERALKIPEDRNILIHCPYCHQDHAWTGANGVFLSMSDNNPSEQFGGKI